MESNSVVDQEKVKEMVAWLESIKRDVAIKTRLCPYGCENGNMWLSDASNEPEAELWFFDLTCDKCHKIDSVSIHHKDVVSMIYKQDAACGNAG